jgi:uncharacterized protein YktA (UPF0223 family)
MLVFGEGAEVIAAVLLSCSLIACTVYTLNGVDGMSDNEVPGVLEFVDVVEANYSVEVPSVLVRIFKANSAVLLRGGLFACTLDGVDGISDNEVPGVLEFVDVVEANYSVEVPSVLVRIFKANASELHEGWPL